MTTMKEMIVMTILTMVVVALKLGDNVSRFGGRIWGSYLVARNLGDTRCPDLGVVFGGSLARRQGVQIWGPYLVVVFSGS